VPRRTTASEIRAAGGAVWRVHDGKVEVALVHRPRYDDWSLPKGKLLPDESELTAAVREVGEELGSQVTVSRRIGTVAYDAAAAHKTVTYWVMRHVAGEFVPNSEVDEVAWLRPSAARDKLTYYVDRRIMNDFAAVPLPDAVILLVRHARAGKRSDWGGNDTERPLDPLGALQAGRLSGLLRAFGPDRIYSADLTRCVQTVQPLADELGLKVRVDRVFGDSAYSRSPSATEDAVLALAKPGKVSVVCSQGVAVPGLVERLGRGVVPSDTRKGAFWVLSVVDGNVVCTDYYEDALG
jgi:8-oxo-dGTP pyrophosphatase MutT (NUDIX family)/phosphohistidine phosphatase SixA